jgi:adenylyl- and sulfurtransferase ThiI
MFGSLNQKMKQKLGLHWTQGEYEIKEVVFKFEDFAREIRQYQTGLKMINISATAILLRTANRVLHEVNADLNQILNEIQN